MKVQDVELHGDRLRRDSVRRSVGHPQRPRIVVNRTHLLKPADERTAVSQLI